jgi:hypothetical protein
MRGCIHSFCMSIDRMLERSPVLAALDPGSDLCSHA